MMRRATFALVLPLATSALLAQTPPPKSPVEGVWKVAEVVWGGRRPDNATPQPGLMIFTKGYFSTVTVMGQQPRVAVVPARDPGNLTDAEKIARYEEWQTFAASSGTYEVDGSRLTRRTVVAKNVNVMSRGEATVWEFRLEGRDVLWLTPTGSLLATEPRYKLTRLE